MSGRNLPLYRTITLIAIHNLIGYSTVQYSTVVMMYDDKYHRTIPQYNMSYNSVVHKNFMIL